MEASEKNYNVEQLGSIDTIGELSDGHLPVTGKKVIFLDFDGVITTYRRKWKIDVDKVRIVNDICAACGAEVVVTSSWRVGFRGDVVGFTGHLSRYFADNGYSEEDRPDFEKFVRSITGLTDTMGGCRGDEIERYLNGHSEISDYVIVDDDSDMLDTQLLNFVQTDTYDGITEREMNLCVCVLNRTNLFSPLRLNQELKYRWKLRCRHPEFPNDIDTILKEYKMRKS